MADMTTLQTALDGYFRDNGAYPGTPGGSACTGAYNNVVNLADALVPKYLSEIPRDPDPPSCSYNYQYWSDTKTFVIIVHFPDIDPTVYLDRWCIGASGGSLAGTPVEQYKRCP